MAKPRKSRDCEKNRGIKYGCSTPFAGLLQVNTFCISTAIYGILSNGPVGEIACAPFSAILQVYNVTRAGKSGVSYNV
jgi:hypothetical protein